MNLLTESLWGDEAFSALAVKLPFKEMIGVVMKDTAPPLFYLLGYGWQKMFGGSEVALRSLSLILIAFSGVMAGLTVWEIGKNKLNSFLVALITFFSPFLFVFAFEWRMYALLSATITLTNYAFLTRKWKLYVLASTMALYTHHFAIFTIFAQGIIYVITQTKWGKVSSVVKSWWPYWLIGLFYSPWLYPMYSQISRVKGSGFWLSAPKLVEVLDLVWRMALGGVEEKWRGITLAVIILLVVGKSWNKVWKPSLILLLVTLSPILISAALSYVITPIFYDRYLLSVIPAVTVLWGVGTKKEFRAALLMLLIIYMVLSVDKFNHPTKRNFRELAGLIKAEIKVGDGLLNYNGNAHHIWESKYYGVGAPIYTPNGPLPLYVGTAQMTQDDTTDTIPRPDRRLIVISSEPTSKMKLPGFMIVKEKYLGDLGYSVWLKR